MTKESIYKVIFNATHEAIFIHAVNSGKILEVNDTSLSMYGYSSKEEILRLDIGDLSANIPPYNHEIALDYILKASTEGPQVYE